MRISEAQDRVSASNIRLRETPTTDRFKRQGATNSPDSLVGELAVAGEPKRIQSTDPLVQPEPSKPHAPARPRGKAVTAAAQRDALMKKRKALVKKTAGLQDK